MIALIGYVAAFLTTVSAVPQIVHTLRTRDVRGISIPMWFSLTSGVALWLVYGIAIRSGPLVASNSVSVALDASVLVLALRYRPLARIEPISEPAN
jgi:MtN3 and saliva related transmembrane protein